MENKISWQKMCMKVNTSFTQSPKLTCFLRLSGHVTQGSGFVGPRLKAGIAYRMDRGNPPE